MTPFYLVWNPRGGQPVVEHPDLNSALREAARLAGVNLGQQFYVLRTLGFARAPTCPVAWTPAIPPDDDMPF